MHQVLVVSLKALAGGSLVVVFALLGEMLEPKRFAGLFSAAPSVALASLTITILDKGPDEARQASIGMVVGAVALVVFCVAARWTVARYEAAGGSALACVAWFAVAIGGYLAVLR